MPEARRVSRVSYDEMLELASLGAGVMHSRSIEFAKKFSVPIHVRSSFSDIPGTMIVSEPELSDRAVSGAALTRDEAKITAVGVPDVPGTSYEIFSRIADRNVTVDMIVQNIGDGGRADISFTVPRDELSVTLEAIDEARTVTGDFDVTHDDQVAKVSVVGMGMATQAGVADRMFLALAEAEINIKMITTSEIKISTLVERDQALAALRAVHNAFALDQDPESIPPLPDAGSRPPSDAADIVHQLQNMERLRIDKIDLDDSQGRVTIHGVPNAPGVAERVFREIAEAGIFVDMIVQSYPSDGEANLSFTVPKESIEQSKVVAENLAKDFPSLQVSSSPDVAKLSVSGIGLRSHTGVAIRMFRALSETGINVQMINTSEVRVHVIVDGNDGEKARAALEEVFSDVM